MKRCDICLEENCGGTFNCECNNCQKVNECYRFLRPTIRITTKCTQSCDHCCFSCTPQSDKMMNIKTAKIIHKFLISNNIKSINVMGGEFVCNKNWFEILSEFLSTGVYMRLVSNGDWAEDKDIQQKLIELKELYKDKLHIAISYDMYHTNSLVSKAEIFLRSNNIKHNIGKSEQDNDNVLVPIGRALGSYGFYSTFGCYCHNPQHMYSFMISEEGEIYKCSFGIWNYANVKEYQSGGFNKRFKEFNKRFYSCFVPSCSVCIRKAAQKDAIADN